MKKRPGLALFKKNYPKYYIHKCAVECIKIIKAINVNFFKNGQSFLFQHFIKIKFVHFSGIRTRIVRVVCEHADHLTNTTAFLVSQSSPSKISGNQISAEFIFSPVWPEILSFRMTNYLLFRFLTKFSSQPSRQLFKKPKLLFVQFTILPIAVKSDAVMVWSFNCTNRNNLTLS